MKRVLLKLSGEALAGEKHLVPLDIGCCKKKAGRKKIERQKSQIMRQKKKELW